MKLKAIIPLILIVFISACSNLDEIKTVENLDINKYAGKWYEIARLPNPYENGLKGVYAIYTPTSREEIKVINVGYNSKGEEKSARASAYPRNGNYAKMRITFFYPFYGDYAVTMLAPDYSYALVESPPYLWILSRKRDLAPQALLEIITHLEEKDIDTSKLIYN